MVVLGPAGNAINRPVYFVPVDSRADKLRKMGKLIEGAAGEGVGFAFFILTGNETSYTSNGHRSDVIKVLEEWLDRTTPATLIVDRKESGRAGRSFARASKKESSHETDTRLAFERRCAEIGKHMGSVAEVCLFLFNFGGEGNLAYWTNTPNAHKAVAAWVKSARSRS
jgi:hypothetical protein